MGSTIVDIRALLNKIKVIKRNAFGYKNFKLFRGRILYIFNGKISGSVKRKMTSKSKNS